MMRRASTMLVFEPLRYSYILQLHERRLWPLLGETEEECADPDPKATALAASLDGEAALFKRMAALATAAEAAFPLGAAARTLEPAAAAGAADAQRMASDGMLARPVLYLGVG